MDYRSTVSTPSPNIPGLPSFGGAQPPTAGGAVQLDRLFLQMQATRQQNEAHNVDMERRFGPRDSMVLSPLLGSNGSLKFEDQDMAGNQDVCNLVSLSLLI